MKTQVILRWLLFVLFSCIAGCSTLTPDPEAPHGKEWFTYSQGHYGGMATARYERDPGFSSLNQTYHIETSKSEGYINARFHEELAPTNVKGTLAVGSNISRYTFNEQL